MVLLYLVYALATSMPFLSLVEFVVFVVLFVVLWWCFPHRDLLLPCCPPSSWQRYLQLLLFFSLLQHHFGIWQTSCVIVFAVVESIKLTFKCRKLPRAKPLPPSGGTFVRWNKHPTVLTHFAGGFSNVQCYIVAAVWVYFWTTVYVLNAASMMKI